MVSCCDVSIALLSFCAMSIHLFLGLPFLSVHEHMRASLSLDTCCIQLKDVLPHLQSRTCLFISHSIFFLVTPSIFRRRTISKALNLFSCAVVKVHLSELYNNTPITRVLYTLTLLVLLIASEDQTLSSIRVTPLASPILLPMSISHPPLELILPPK